MLFFPFFASSNGEGEESDEVKKILQHAFSLPFAKMEKVETIKQEVKHLKVLMEDLKNKKKQLKAELKEKDKQFKDMQEELNRQDISNIDQHHRVGARARHEYPADRGGRVGQQYHHGQGV